MKAAHTVRRSARRMFFTLWGRLIACRRLQGGTGSSACLSLLPMALLLAAPTHAQTGSGSEPVRYMGGVSIDLNAPDG